MVCRQECECGKLLELAPGLALVLAPEPEHEHEPELALEPAHALEPDVSMTVLKHPYGHCLGADTLAARPWQQLLQPSSASLRWLPSV